MLRSINSIVFDNLMKLICLVDLQECVKSRALRSVLAVRDVSQEEAIEAVESVFEKCYNDLEPIGRRIRRNSDHMQKAYFDRKSMGYL